MHSKYVEWPTGGLHILRGLTSIVQTNRTYEVLWSLVAHRAQRSFQV